MTAIHDGDAPVRRGAVDDAIRKMRAAAAADGRDDAPGTAGTVDHAVLRTVLATLPHDDQRLLWDRHVVGRELSAIATELGMHARAVLRRLRHAEERLGAAFAAAHARACPPSCLDTRQALHSYVRHRLSPPRRTVLEAHLFGCQGCMRAFIDVREAGWALRDAGPLLLAGTAAGVAAGGPIVVGALGAGATGVGLLGWTGPVGAALLAAVEWVRALVLRFGQLGKAGMIGAGTVAGVAVAAVAVALSGGAGTPSAAPPVPGPTSSAVAPAPDTEDAASPDAPPEPEPSASRSAEPTASEEAVAPPVTADPTPDPAQDPAPAPPPSGTTPAPSPEPDDPDTGATPSPEPSASTAPSPSPSPTPSPTPTRTSPSPTPTPSPSVPSPKPTPTSKPTPKPTPTPVRTTVTVTTSGLRGVYAVTATDPDAEVVKVSEDRRWLRAKECRREGWHVASWRNDVGELTVTVEAAPGVAPDVTVDRVVNWPAWIWTC
ncbi:zf-HC2 domain-containing protein [Isoptericola sp. NPDC019693]|uniref:zf-HC2 domain-containing protein n=1 Tax=Isoptericola sp. NPDC019693 TaxID=3364009 RepID=UPI0037A594C5